MIKTLNKILYVEDSPFIRKVTQVALETVGGFTLKVCEHGEEALEVGPIFDPDLILLDVMMPGMDGPTTLAALRRVPSMKDTPVIFMTGKVQPEEIQSYRDLGALDVIAKPFDSMKLADLVRSIWARAEG